MKCQWWTLDDEDTPGAAGCENEATHNGNCNIDSSMQSPVCAEHTCRCSVTFEEAAQRKERQRVPSDWMAL